MFEKLADFFFGPRDAQKHALMVFSPTQSFAGEPKVVVELFNVGLTFYHLRRPRWGAQQITQWAQALPKELRSRVILHQQPQLVQRLGLGGFCAGTPAELPPETLDCGLRMAICEDFEQILAARKQCSAVLVGPIFLNENRDLTVPARTPEELATSVKYFKKQFPNSPMRFVAYGGVNSPAAVRACRELDCFDGFASMSGIWNNNALAEDNFRALCKQW